MKNIKKIVSAVIAAAMMFTVPLGQTAYAYQVIPDSDTFIEYNVQADSGVCGESLNWSFSG
jgi:hypothetical protein